VVCSLAEILLCKHKKKLDGAGAGSLPEDKEEGNESSVSSGPHGAAGQHLGSQLGNKRNSDFSPIPVLHCLLKTFLNLVQESKKKDTLL